MDAKTRKELLKYVTKKKLSKENTNVSDQAVSTQRESRRHASGVSCVIRKYVGNCRVEVGTDGVR